jgi:methionyl-tRNA formyltransferase
MEKTAVMDTAQQIVFWGTPEAAADCLCYLIGRDLNIAGVVTQPDKPVGRKHVVTPPPVKCIAIDRHIPVLQPVSIKTPEFRQRLTALKPHVCVVVAYGKIIPAEILSIPEAFINLHFSLLPRYRGAAPVQWALMDGVKKTGVTVQHLVQKMDAGDIILQEQVAVADTDTADTLLNKCVSVGAPVLYRALELVLKGKAPRTKQNEAAATYACKITREHGYIDWHRPARDIYNQVRACTPWPGTTTWHTGTEYKIRSVRVDDYTATGSAPGTLITSKHRLKVATGRGLLEILEIQPSNKPRMSAEAFLSGYRTQLYRFESFQPENR